MQYAITNKTTFLANSRILKADFILFRDFENYQARAKEFMASAEKAGVKVICCHIGGATRRGALSDAFADMVLPLSSFIVVKEDGNEDGKFTSFASSHNIPITLVYGSKDTVDAFKAIF